MKTIKIIATALLIATSYNCKDFKEGFKQGMEDAKKAEAAAEAAKEEVQVESISFKMEAKSESNVTGNVTFTEADGKVSMTAMLTGLSEGEHAIHIHDKADCSSADGGRYWQLYCRR